MLIISFWLKKIEANPKTRKFKVNGRVRITKYKNISSKSYTKNWSRKLFIIDSVLKTNRWTYEFKNINGGKMIQSFCEKELLLRKL